MICMLIPEHLHIVFLWSTDLIEYFLQILKKMLHFILGGTSLSGEKLQHCINRAITRNKEISKLMGKVIESTKTAK